MAKPGKKRSFQYQRRSADSVKERANSKGGNFDSIIQSKYKVYKVKDGKNLLRILPPTWEDAKHYGYTVWINYGIGVDNQSYLSLYKMKGEKDPLAEARRRADKDGDEDVAKALAPRERVIIWVIDREAEDDGPQLWLAPVSVDKDILQICVDEDTGEVIMLDDPEEGADIRFHKEGKGLKTKYPAAKMRVLKPSPLHEDEALQEEWLAYIQDNPIPDCLQYYDYKHIAEAFGGSVRTDDDDDKPRRRRDDDDDDDADEKPTRRSSRARAADDDDEETPRRRRNTRSDDEDEEAPWEGRRRGKGDEDEDEDEEKPASRRAARRAERDEADEESDDEAPPPRRRARTDEEDEEAETPPRRNARKGKEEADEDDDDDNEREAPPSKGTLRDRIRRGQEAARSKSRD